MSELRFDGRVAVVTGAGGGLGKAYALLLGSRGAKVVVNDLGGGRHGDGKSSSLADAVVQEIKSKGGSAVADYNSVVEGEKIIKTALDNFGRIDILINNAGILRDKSFPKISEQDWDLIQAVHLKGAFKTTQAAWETFKKQKFGRVIMTSSNAGLYGNFGQANYSAAKMGLVGLAYTLAVEGVKYNIHTNVIVPTAASRLTEDILPPDLYQEMKPELIAPVVAYLCHESCGENGTVIDSAIGYAAKVHLVRSQGAHLRKQASEPVSIESVRDKWSKVVDMSAAKHYDKIGEVTVALAQNLQDLKEQINDGRDAVWSKYSYSSKDLIVYALGVGATVNNTSDLRFLYENHELFAPLPTFFVLPSIQASFEANLVTDAMPPGKFADFTNLLHGEQYIEVLGELPGTEGAVDTRSYVAEVLDKGANAVVIVNSDTYSGKELVVRNQQHVVVRGQGGFGGARESKLAVPVQPPPKRAPDTVAEQLTSVDQAALYRLSGDVNPLHIDPAMAASSGYPKPILHGLSSLGFSSRHVLLKYGGNDAANFKALKVRFASPVLPGQTLQTEMWLEGKRVFFQTKVKETGKVVIGGAYMDLNKVVSESNGAPAAAPAAGAPATSAGPLRSDALFAKIKEEITKQPEKAKSIGGVFLYNITENGKTVKQWTLDLKSGVVHEGSPKSGKPDTTMSLSDGDLVEIASGTLNPQVAYLKGRFKISGNLMLAQKLGPLLKSDAKI